RRSTFTTTVLSPLLLTTTPCSTRLDILLSLRPLDAGLLAQGGTHTGDVAADMGHARGILQLTGRLLEAQVELLLLQIGELGSQLVLGLTDQFGSLHDYAPSPRRVMTLVRIGSLAAPRMNASLASAAGMPSSSNMTRPGLMRHTHNSGEPLPEPMRTSAGFFDTGTSGKTRIHIRPWRLMWRVIARRAASI